MSEYGSDFVTITDEQGNSYELEKLFSFEYKNETYSAFVPAPDGSGEIDYDTILFHVVEEAGEELFENIDPEMYDAVYEKYIDLLFEA